MNGHTPLALLGYTMVDDTRTIQNRTRRQGLQPHNGNDGKGMRALSLAVTRFEPRPAKTADVQGGMPMGTRIHQVVLAHQCVIGIPKLHQGAG